MFYFLSLRFVSRGCGIFGHLDLLRNRGVNRDLGNPTNDDCVAEPSGRLASSPRFGTERVTALGVVLYLSKEARGTTTFRIGD